MAILGIDEVGRGPLAGPLVVGAVILPSGEAEWVLELRDSKKLSAKKREKLSTIILKEAVATGLGWVFPAELDKVGISEALRLATRRAVKAVQEFHTPFSQIVIDGKVNFLAGTALEKYVSTMPKADDLVREVSAASIIAKVARDKYMVELSTKFPEYGFESHVGYGTKKHLEAISKFGICAEHRRSFEPIRTMVSFDSNLDGMRDTARPGSSSFKTVKNTTAIGERGEAAVTKYLVSAGHKIITKNHKTKLAEIDIISTKGDKIYFTEVKYRKTATHGSGLDAITKTKQQQMRFAAEFYLKCHREFAHLSPMLAVSSVSGENFEVETWFPLV